MIRSIRRGLLASAVAALALLAAACGGQGSDPTSTTSADWTKSNNPGFATQTIHHILPAPFGITDCSLAEYVGILSAFNVGQINTAQLALSVSTDVEVRNLAQKMLTDDQNLASHLSSWMSSFNLQPVQSEISVDIQLVAQQRLASLRDDKNFDRDFVVGEIGGSWMLNGFFDSVSFMQDFSSASSDSGNGSQGGLTAASGSENNGNANLHDSERQFVSIISMATQAVQSHLSQAFQVESKLVGACGVAPAVVTEPDAGASSDAGASCDSGHSD